MNYSDTIDWYNKNAKVYAEKTDATKNFNEDQIIEFASYLKKGASVLDVGCGSGRDSKRLYDRGFHVVGIDISQNLIREAQQRYPEITFTQDDILQSSFSDSQFDGIWAQASLIHFDTLAEFETAIAEIYRILKTGGIVHLLLREDVSRVDSPDSIGEDISSLQRNFLYIEKGYLEKLLHKFHLDKIQIESYVESGSNPNRAKNDKIPYMRVLGVKG